ncbi:hypothetical protein [Maribacter sp. 2307ULW6-5]|uniref:hypothetical protein n=1 Tax=Maribacter sp. 2307ULW6-5 TaxID=3386275 RepID=UPI0039BD1E23
MKKIARVSLANLWVIGITALALACNGKPTLAEVEAEELARNVAFDSLFYGLHFGMTMQDFYDHSYDMNQEGIFFQNNMNVEVIIHYDEDFSSPVDFVFFPDTSYPTIQKVDGYMMFRQWAPFTKEYPASKLQEELKEKMEEWYGGREFIKIEHPKGHWPYAYAKVDGNRKIVLYRSFDDQKVEVVFENLNAKHKE